MQYTTRKLEVTRGHVREQEERVAQQRKKIVQALADRHPADELQARLLIMEQSLLALARFLKILERDLQAELGIHRYQTQKRIKDRRMSPRDEAIAEAADRFASQATAAVLSSDEDDSLDQMAKAMRSLSRR